MLIFGQKDILGVTFDEVIFWDSNYVYVNIQWNILINIVAIGLKHSFLPFVYNKVC